MGSDAGESSQGVPDPEDVSSLDQLPLHSTDLLTLLDETGVVLYESPSIERLYGYDQGELVGEQASEYFHPEDRDRVVEAFAAIVSEESHHVETVDYRHLVADGSYKWIESVGSSDPTPDGNYVINSRDISERKRRERAVERTHDQLQSERDGKEAIRQLLLRTSTDGEIADTVCRLLVDTYGYEAAWVVRKRGEGADRLADLPQIGSHGADTGFRLGTGDTTTVDEATRRTLAADEPVTVTTESDGEPAFVDRLTDRGRYSVRSVPLEHEGLSYGELTLLRTSPGSEVARQLVDEVAAALAFKQRVHRQQEALAAETVTELTLRYAGEHALTALSRAVRGTDGEPGPTVVVKELHRRDGGGTTYLVKTRAVDAETLRDVARGLPSVREASVVTGTGAAAVVSLRAEAASIRSVLGGYGGIIQSITARDGRIDLAVEFPRRTDISAVVDAVQDHWPDANLHACRSRTVDDEHLRPFGSLTRKQEDALRAASLAGFFARPQEANAEDVAGTLGTSASTFLYHLRNAEQTVFQEAFTEDPRTD